MNPGLSETKSINRESWPRFDDNLYMNPFAPFFNVIVTYESFFFLFPTL
jgi:hypothetical protein